MSKEIEKLKNYDKIKELSILSKKFIADNETNFAEIKLNMDAKGLRKSEKVLLFVSNKSIFDEYRFFDVVEKKNRSIVIYSPYNDLAKEGLTFKSHDQTYTIKYTCIICITIICQMTATTSYKHMLIILC